MTTVATTKEELSTDLNLPRFFMVDRIGKKPCADSKEVRLFEKKEKAFPQMAGFMSRFLCGGIKRLLAQKLTKQRTKITHPM